MLKVFKALADETRLKLVELLAEKHYCVNALAQRLEISDSAVSQHLRVLREAGLVSGEKRGYWVHYSIDIPGWQELQEDFQHIYGQDFLKQAVRARNHPCCRKRKKQGDSQ